MDGTADIDRRMLVALLVAIILAAAVVGLVSRGGGTSDAGAAASADASTTASTTGAHDAQHAAGGATTVTTPTGVDHHTGNADQQAELQPDVPLDNATRDAVAAELVAAREFALRYPTVTDALNAGFIVAGGFAPGVGAHYVGIAAAASGRVDAGNAATRIYDGTSPGSRIVGLMYLGGAAQAPEGFAGPNDHWHRHSGVCTKFSAGKIEVPFPADADVTKAMCTEKQGVFMERTTWMVHAWVVPGWESPLGVFSHDNPNLKCGDGTANTDKAGFCQGT
jgi:hypothetical protein